MSRVSSLLIFASLACLVFITQQNGPDINPYKELGVSRNAGEKEIKNSYRKQAKKWHPDRNDSPDAEAKFMRITQAYEILSDTDRRQMYDDYGTTQEPRQGGGGGGNGYQRDSYDQFFRDFHFGGFGGGGSGGFRFNGGGQRRKSSEEEINKKIYDETILPNSHIKPFLIFSYTEFCYSCMAVDQVWEVLKQEIKNIGFGAGHSDASWNRGLSKALGINTVPSIVGVINGRVYHFRGEYTIKNLRDFVRKLIPSKLMIEADQYNFNRTIYESMEENKVLAVFASFSNQVTLRYQMPCYLMSSNVKCAFIKLGAIDNDFREYLSENYKLDLAESKLEREEIMYVFKENLNAPATSIDKFSYKPAYNVRAKELTYASILQTLEEQKFLHLPRVTSTQHFYDLCTSWSQTDLDELTPNAEKMICVLIVADSTIKSPNFLFNENQKSKFLKKLTGDDYFKRHARFAYIYVDQQTEFFARLTRTLKIKPVESDKNKSFFENKIILLKRLDNRQAQFEVYDFKDTEKDLLMKQQLDALKQVLRTTKKLEFKMNIPQFHDETTQNLLNLVIDYLEDLWSQVNDRVFWENLFGNSSYMMIIFCSILFIWLMTMFSADQSDPLSASRSKTKESKPNKQSKQSNSSFNIYSSPDEGHTQNSQSHYYESDTSYSASNSFDNSGTDSHYYASTRRSHKLELPEMTSQNYEQFVKKLPNGWRTILLIVNNQNKDLVVEKFTQVVANFNNRTYGLRFAYVNADNPSSQKWLNEIMFQKYRSMGEENDIDISDDEYDDIIKANLNKLDYDRSLICLAINQQRRHFLIFNIDIKNLFTTCDSNVTEACFGLDDSRRFENKYQIELTNWLDKLTEGLNMSDKFTVKNWPDFN